MTYDVYSLLSLALIYISLVCKMLYKKSRPGCLLTVLLSTLQKLNSCSSVSSNNFSKYTHVTSTLITQPQSWLYLWSTTFFHTEQIYALPKSCYSNIRQILCIFPCLGFKTASATSIVHSKLDYCNSLYNLSNSQLKSRQHIQNSLARAVARAVVKAPKFSHAFPILKYLHWLETNERIAL